MKPNTRAPKKAPCWVSLPQPNLQLLMRMRQVGWVKRSETGATTSGLPLQKSSLLGFLTSTQPTTCGTGILPVTGKMPSIYISLGIAIFRIAIVNFLPLVF